MSFQQPQSWLQQKPLGWECLLPASGRCRPWRRRSRPTPTCSIPKGPSRAPSNVCGLFAVSADGPRTTSPYARCGRWMPFPPQTSACSAALPVWMPTVPLQLSLSSAPNLGDPGAPMPRSTSGLLRRQGVFMRDVVQLSRRRPPHLSVDRPPHLSLDRPGHLSLERLATLLGELLIVTDREGNLRAVDWADYETRMRRLLRLHYGERGFSLEPARNSSDAARALARYFAGELSAIEGLPVKTGGTPFQRMVWHALQQIPCGETVSYAGLAAKIGRPAAVRAVGLANGANPVGIVVPCHRVIGSNGSLTGYGGGMHRKRWLLEHESSAAGAHPQRKILF